MGRITYERLTTIYFGSDADATRMLYTALASHGPIGEIGLNLFRAHKASARAKGYRGGNGKRSYREMAYDRKNWSMGQLAEILASNAADLGLVWGWGEDLGQTWHSVVLFVEIPTGQVSFHTNLRGPGPTYEKGWDGTRGAGVERICGWCARILDGRGMSTPDGPVGGDIAPRYTEPEQLKLGVGDGG